MADILLQEIGDALLQEDGSLILLEQQTEPPGGNLSKPRRHLGNTPGPKTQNGQGSFLYRLTIVGQGTIDGARSTPELVPVGRGELIHDALRYLRYRRKAAGELAARHHFELIPVRTYIGCATDDPNDLAYFDLPRL